MGDGGFNGSSCRKQKDSTNFGSKQYEICDKQKNFSPRKSFIKVFSYNFAKELQIPEEFVVNFKGSVPNRFIIECATTRKCWRVEAEEDEDGKVCFGEGWNDFVEEHSLEIGCFLVFEYEEQSIFQVKIYGKNGCEKATFKGTELGFTKSAKPTEIEEGESDEFEELPDKRPQKTRRLSPYKHGIYKKHGVGRTYAKATEVFISENSVSFTTTFHTIKKHQFVRLSIPKAVAVAKKLPSKGQVILQVAEGKCWPVKLIHRRETRVISYFYKGWKEFVEDNKIVGGDKLRFEFITDDLIQVHVTRNSHVEYLSGDEASRLLNMDCEDDEPVTADDEALEESGTGKRSSSEFRSSSFSFTWKETTTGGYLHIPKAIGLDQNLKHKDRVVIRDPEGKCWPLTVCVWSDGRVGLARGWRDFWVGHNITAGDTLHFDFVSQNLIQVTIHRGTRFLESTPKRTLNDSEAMGNGETVVEGAPNTPELSSVVNGGKSQAL